MTQEELREINKKVAVELGIDTTIKNEHDWRTEDEEYGGDSAKVDTLAYQSGYHNGPECKRCQYHYCVHCGEGEPEPCEVSILCYSTDPQAADLVRQEIERRGWSWNLLMASSQPSYIAEVQVIPRDNSTWQDSWEFNGYGKTPHLALCLAFLQACEAIKEGES